MNSSILIPMTFLCALGTTLAELPAQEPKRADPASPQLVELGVPGVTNTWFEYKTLSPDKRLIACIYFHRLENVISLHDSKTGKQVRRIVGHGDEVRELRFTPDGRILASRCVNEDRKGWALWDVKTGKLLLRLPVPSGGD
jgi:WD40 repeat protein